MNQSSISQSELGIGFCNIDQPLLGKALKASAEPTSLPATSDSVAVTIKTGQRTSAPRTAPTISTP
jgi:hypothetical protein